MKILFVHLGGNPPSYLVENLLSFRARFPHLDLRLILSEGSRVPKQLRSISVYFDNSNQRDHLFANSRHDPKFRNQFWRRSIERILAVCEYQMQNADSQVLHIESDILVLPGFPFEKLTEIKSVAWQNYNDDRDVASILFLPNKNLSSWLYDKLVDHVLNNYTATDMTSLREIRRNHPDQCLIIPCLSEGINSAVNQGYLSAHLNSVNPVLMKGIFDSAQIGMWLTGMDPRNTYGVLRIHDRTILDNAEAPLDPSRLNYSIDAQGNLYAILESNYEVPIFSLHIHSKRLQLFKSDYIEELTGFVKLANSQKQAIRRFEIFVLFKLFYNSLISGNLISFLLGIPFVYKVRRKIRKVVRRS